MDPRIFWIHPTERQIPKYGRLLYFCHVQNVRVFLSKKAVQLPDALLAPFFVHKTCYW